MLTSFASFYQSRKFGAHLTFILNHVIVIISLYRWFSSATSKAYLPNPAFEQMKRKLEVKNVKTRVTEAMETRPQSRKRSGTTYSY